MSDRLLKSLPQTYLPPAAPTDAAGAAVRLPKAAIVQGPGAGHARQLRPQPGVVTGAAARWRYLVFVLILAHPGHLLHQLRQLVPPSDHQQAAAQEALHEGQHGQGVHVSTQGGLLKLSTGGVE